ncbi:MAG TPA: glucosamine-6-phosphate deaminase [Feifaniaceae bacterium]|nr:glucosamine-6-phosphate deaminase [Feifaniaceae bacterium]
MKIHVCSKEQAAEQAAKRYVELLKRKPNAVLGFATGSTPLRLYQELIRLYKKGELSFREATSFNLDEYVGLDGSNSQSYRHFMNKNLFEQIDIPSEQTFVPDGTHCSAETAAEYDVEIQAAGGIDLQLLGVGRNGHIGFNEPGTSFDSVTHRVQLSRSTREANARFFHSLEEVPTEAVSMGIKTVMNARGILLFAQGEEKAEVIQKAVYGPVTEDVPASILQLHPFVELFLDPEAAKLL